MGAIKTPGIYIVEKSAFPSAVVEVATAVPAFIGYTEKADNKGKSLSNQPWRITSMDEFCNHFGFGPAAQFSFGAAQAQADSSFSLGETAYALAQTAGRYLLYYSVRLFFENGGGACYIASVGTYSDPIDPNSLTGGIDRLVNEQEPSILAVPDAVLLTQDGCFAVQRHMLSHCGNLTRNRFAILDVFDGFRSMQDPSGDPVAAFRNSLGINLLDYGAAYYPWLNTSITRAGELSYGNLDKDGRALLQDLLKAELNTDKQPGSNAQQRQDAVDGMAKDDMPANRKAELHESLMAMSPLYNRILTEMANRLNLLPPSAAMAGVYAVVDNNRGVWKAPANVSLNSVVAPSVSLTNLDQEELRVTPQGKSINAIRTFVGEGTLVWGARTLDGNSLDWRYINVRRTFIMLEESIRLATKAYVFEPNVANTWVTIKSVIRNFLTAIWKKGGLAGASPDDAFAVLVGLGETMTPEDILEGILRVTALVAISRPAEFLEITFQMQMQKS